MVDRKGKGEYLNRTLDLQLKQIDKIVYIFAVPNVPSKSEIHNNNRVYAEPDIYETCPLCDSHLPNANSAIPPPHYPLQHRSVMDTVRRKLVNRVLCDTCTSEVPVKI